MAKITEPTDDQLRDIARKATGTGYYSGGVKALRAVWDAARRVPVAERMPEGVQELVEWARDAALALESATEIGKRSCRAGDHLNYSNHDRLLREFAALEAAYSRKGAVDDPR